MKKYKAISWVLCLMLVLQCLAVSAGAVSINDVQTVPTQAAEETTAGSGEIAIPEMTMPQADRDIPFGQLSILKGCRTIEGMVPLAGSERKLPSAQGVFVYEVNTDTVIYSYNPDAKLSPGTLAKIVTALVAIENCELNEIVTCSPGIQSKIPGGSQNVKLKSEEQLTVEDLLHCVLLQSANDAAVALAEHVGSSTTLYADMMNNRVRQMGCTNTQFGNISGLDTAVSYTTARDMARIMTEASKNETFMRIAFTTKYTVPATEMSEARDLVTGNYMIDNSIIPQYLDNDVKGGLASYSEASGANITCVAEHNNMKLVCVVLGAIRQFDAEQTWKPIVYGNFDELQQLLEYLYSGFKVNRILYDGQALSQFQVIDGESDVVGKPVINYDTVLPIDCSMDNLYTTYTATGNGYQAPIKAGDKIATVAVQYLNSYIAEAEIFAMNNVRSASDSSTEVQSSAVKAEDSGGFLGFLGALAVIAAGVFVIHFAYNSYRRARRRMQHRRRRASRRRSF